MRSTLERKRAEEAMRRKQELESIGALAAGVAHDFNNLLTGILGNACMLRDNLPPGAPDRYFAEEIIKSSERAADLTRQLLAYSGKVRSKVAPLDVSALVTESVALMRPLVPAGVEVRCELAAVPAIPADREQIRQLLLNLVSERGRGHRRRARLGAHRDGRRDAESRRNSTLRRMRGGPARLPGGARHRPRHGPGGGNQDFDPFFSTKFFGRGLGLAAVAGIVRMHRGSLRVTTAPQAGSTFRVLLPVHPA